MKFLIALVLLFGPTTTFAAKVKCADFKNQKQAQAYFNAKKPGYRSLDRDKDGIACESLR
jgi:hypothetical protein